VLRRLRRDEDNVAARLLADNGQYRLGKAEGTENVRVHDTPQFGDIRVHDGVSARGDAGVVDQDIDFPECLNRIAHGDFDLFKIRQIRWENSGPASESGYLLRRFSGRICIPPINNCRISAIFGQCQRNPLAYTPSSAGD
jgi:hypothetical protein